MAGYSATLKDGREIYIPTWPVNIALENLTMAGKYLGTDRFITISELNYAAVIMAIANATDAKEASNLVQHFVCQARIAGEKITPETISTMFERDLKSVAEIFAHVAHSQYADFFELGLAKENSPGV